MLDLIDQRYKIIKTLGSGLSGDVFAVKDADGKKALKFLKKVQFNVSRDEALQNFKNEFSILSELNHPGIARILDFGFDPKIEKYYFTSELIEGRDFFTATELLPMEAVEDLVVQILRALSYLHSRGIYHFDIKPQNILVAIHNEKRVAKIIDFGLAGFSSPRKKVGTPAYMAPEIIMGGNLDGRTDLYSLGVLIYKVLTRENPFASKDLKETFARHQNFIPKPPSQVNSAVPAFWDTIIARLLAKKPSDRYHDGASVIRDFNFLAGRNYEMETVVTRLSYLPEKGKLIGRTKEVDIFRNLFDLIMKQEDTHVSRLLILEGKIGTGKTRLLSEFKYHCQLNAVPVIMWDSFLMESSKPPFCLQIDEQAIANPDEVNQLLQKYSNQKVIILWATSKAPVGWSHAEIIHLHSFTEEELTQYLAMVMGLENPPAKLVKQIFKRTDGNPLFVSELLKTMLASNFLLDASGRWSGATFEDIGIDFDKLEVPETLSQLLEARIKVLDENQKAVLEWLAVAGEPLSINEIRFLTNLPNPQAALLFLTKEDLISRTDREHHYFFTNVLLRDVIYQGLNLAHKQKKHDALALYYRQNVNDREKALWHEGQGTDALKAIEALLILGDLFLKKENHGKAVSIFENAWEKAQNISDKNLTNKAEQRLAESLVDIRDIRRAITHFEHLKEGPEIQRSLRIHLLQQLGDLYGKIDEFDHALQLFDEALTLLDEKDSSFHVEKLILENNRANIFMKKGLLVESESIFRKTLKEWETLSEIDQKQVTNNWLADLLILQKRYDEASAYLDGLESFVEKAGDTYLWARALYVRGDLFFKKMIDAPEAEKAGIRNKALKFFEKSLELAKQVNALDLMLRTYNGLGNLHYYEKDFTKTIDGYLRALAIARKMEDWQTAATISLNLGNIYKMDGKFHDAYSYLVYAINTLKDIPHKNSYTWLHLFNSHIEIAEAYRELKNLPKAEESLDAAYKLVGEHPHLVSYEFWVWLERAKVYHKENHTSLLDQALFKAQELAKQTHEQEEIKKFQESMTKEEGIASSSLPSLPWNLKVMKVEKTDISDSEFGKILQINKFLNTEHDPQLLMKMVLNYALEFTGAECGLILLVGDEGELEIKSSANTAVNADLTQISTSVAKRCMETGEVVASQDALADGRFDTSESIVLNELKSILSMPLKSRNKIVGVLYLDNRMKTHAFENMNMSILQAFCDQVGIAIENTRLLNQYQEAKAQLEAKLEQTAGELEEIKEILRSETGDYKSKYSYSHIISKSKPMQEVFKILDKITETNLAVFISGASGTGKELIAKAMHFNNAIRSGKRFIAINCGAIPPNLIESELFGYKAGSFTGAHRDKKGLFEEATGGTLLLDEIGELKPELQVKLLRVLQEGEVRRIGDTKSIKVDVRIVSASHKNLEEMVKINQFREDLYYRLCQIKLFLPPLAQRKEDIPLLANHFVEKFKQENNVKDKIRVAPALMKAFFQHNWPGNIRELENLVNVACALRTGNELDFSSIPANYSLLQNFKQKGLGNLALVAAKEPFGPKEIAFDSHNKYDPAKTWNEYETLIIAKGYAHYQFKKNETAQGLGISPSTLYKKIKEYDLENKENPIYKDEFVYEAAQSLKNYIPKIFKAVLEYCDNHPYAAIRQLGVSQGYFYKIIKAAKVA
ncbi:MAG: hypothetical protein A2048_04335 [Deltaproteobacteria bacterium GWA2_45_12]|nr:MAG: hypothetical protein A2048_04335 [Deltaproteobacteria bacterium GWA2_45_12]